MLRFSQVFIPIPLNAFCKRGLEGLKGRSLTGEFKQSLTNSWIHAKMYVKLSKPLW
jgi:hypothetical protein